MNPLAKLKQRFSSWLYIAEVDKSMIDFVASILLSIKFKVKPIWGYLIGPSGGVKSEILKAFDIPNRTYFLDIVTPAALVSGFRGGGKDPSILPDLHEKFLVIKDFSPFMSLTRESREAIFSLWRAVYDGEFFPGFGNIGRVGYQVRFGILIATTPVIDTLRTVHQVLGERFISYRQRIPERKAATRQALKNLRFMKHMKKVLRLAVLEFWKEVPDISISDIRLDNSHKEYLIELADLVARCRSRVLRVSLGREIAYEPKPEIGTRLVQQLKTLLTSHTLASGRTVPEFEDFRVVLRVARDSISARTARILECLYWRRKSAEVLETGEGKEKLLKRTYIDAIKLTNMLDLSYKTVTTLCEDLSALGIVETKKGKKKWGRRSFRIVNPILQQMDETSFWSEKSIPLYPPEKLKRKKRKARQ